MTEQWLPMPGYPGYEVSDLGNARSLNRVVAYKDGRRGKYKGTPLRRIVSSTGDGKDYYRVSMTGPNGRKHWRMANAVLTAHVGPRPFPDAVARHLNDDGLDDRLVNLAWGTQSENMRDMYRNGKRSNRVANRNTSTQEEMRKENE